MYVFVVGFFFISQTWYCKVNLICNPTCISGVRHTSFQKYASWLCHAQLFLPFFLNFCRIGTELKSPMLVCICGCFPNVVCPVIMVGGHSWTCFSGIFLFSCPSRNNKFKWKLQSVSFTLLHSAQMLNLHRSWFNPLHTVGKKAGFFLTSVFKTW